MYLVGDQENGPLETIDDLLEYFRSSGKPREQWRIGTEHEMIGVCATGSNAGAAPSYESGIGPVLESLAGRGWQAIREGDHIIALTCHDNQVAIEPGGQLEHAARPLTDSPSLVKDLYWFLEQIAEPSRALNCAWLSLAFRPFGTLDDVQFMPKSRYEIMRDYMPTRGALAHEMMKRTATVQVNLDYENEADASMKLRAAMSVNPLLTAMYANSPIVDGKVSGYQSYRAHVWTATDPDRCGLLPFVFEDGNLFRQYTEWALDVPMFFVHRDGYVPAHGQTFRQFWKHGFQGHRATLDDWGLHLSTLFPEVRMKQYFELRGCDTGSIPMIAALGALSRGFLYDASACAAATTLTDHLGFAERVALGVAVERQGLAAQVPGGASVAELANELLAIASDGLERQGAESEIEFLAPLRDIVENRRTQADHAIELWQTHQGSPEAFIAALAHELQAPR